MSTMDPTNDDHDDAPALEPISEEAVRSRLDPGEGWPIALESLDDYYSGEPRKPFDGAGDIYRRYTAARARHAADRRLTAEGKAAADAEIAQELLPEVAKLRESVRRKVEGLDGNLHKLTTTALKVPDDEDAADPFAPSPGEIRGWLRSLPDDKREDAVERLVRDGDVRALRAVLSAPEVLSGVSIELAQELRGDVIRKSDPKRHDTIMAVKQGYAAAERALSGLERFLVYDTSPAGIRDRLAYPDTPTGQLMRIRAGG